MNLASFLILDTSISTPFFRKKSKFLRLESLILNQLRKQKRTKSQKQGIAIRLAVMRYKLALLFRNTGAGQNSLFSK